MADNLNTPKFRAAFISVFTATTPREADASQKPKYSIRAVFPPDADFKQLKAAAEACAKEKWGDKIPKGLRSPFRKNEELDNPVPGIDDDWVVMTFSANENRRPGIVDAKLNDIINEDDVYAGAWYRAQVRPYAYDQQGNKGVAFGLQNVQKLKDDEPLGAGRTPASKAFEAVDDENEDEPAGTTKTAGALFD